MTESLGTQWIVELYGCDPRGLERVPHVERALLASARAARAHVVEHNFHQFRPFGVSGVVVLQESHITIHTWPEHGYAAVDIFFCDPAVNVESAIEELRDRFQPRNVHAYELKRGSRRDLEQYGADRPHAPATEPVAGDVQAFYVPFVQRWLSWFRGPAPAPD